MRSMKAKLAEVISLDDYRQRKSVERAVNSAVAALDSPPAPESVPFEARCTACGIIWAAQGDDLRCPWCGGRSE